MPRRKRVAGLRLRGVKRTNASVASSGLTSRQERFVAEYLIDLNGKQAAIRAGYSAKTAESQASRLLSKAKVAAAVEGGKKATRGRAILSREQVLRELSAIAGGDVREYYDLQGNLRPVHELSDRAAAALAGIEVEELFEGRGEDRKKIGRVRKIKRFDKNKALELLGRHLGLWSDPEKPPPQGPGMTVIVQAGAQVDGNRVTAGARVVVDLPPPK